MDLNVEAKAKVSQWLAECQAQEVKPWEYDFKREVFDSSLFNEDPVKRILEKDDHQYKGYRGETESSDLAQAIYRVLWGANYTSVVGEGRDCDADVMNSFWTIFSNYVRAKGPSFFEPAEAIFNNETNKFPNKTGKFRTDTEKNRLLLATYKPSGAKAGGNWHAVLLHEFDRPAFELNNPSLQRCAELTHTIGNLALVPKGYNSSPRGKGTDEGGLKHDDAHDTWAALLMGSSPNSLSNFSWISEDGTRVLNCASITEYCERFLMTDFYQAAYPYELTARGQADFLTKINTAIEERGQLMTRKLCLAVGIDGQWFEDKDDPARGGTN